MNEQSFVTDGLSGSVFLPDGELDSVTVCCHGWGGSGKLFRLTEKLRNKLVKRKSALVTFDFFGCGKSVGLYEDMTYGVWAQNIASITDWTEKQGLCAKKRVGLFGFSSGSTAAFRYAENGGECAYIISAATCVSANIGMGEGGAAKRLAECDAGCVFMGRYVKRAFLEDCIANAPLAGLRGITQPVLLLQGLADNEFRIADARNAHGLIRSSDLLEYEGASHSLESSSTEAANDVIAWLEKRGFLYNAL